MKDRDVVARLRPPFLREIQQEIESKGLPGAASDILRRSNIHVNVEGEIDRLRNHPGGLLLVGDHKNQWEFAAMAGLMGEIGRRDMLNVAKFYVERQLNLALGSTAVAPHIAPVYPRILAKDRPEFWNYETLNRVMYRRSLLTFQQSAEANDRSLTAASKRLEQGCVVNIFPTGRITDARKAPWRAGVGRIITGISEEKRTDVLLVPYDAVDLRRWRFLAGIVLHDAMTGPTGENVTVRVGPLQSVAELMSEVAPTDQEDAAVLTAVLRNNFLQDRL
jgi:hypothetical protein